MKRLRYLAAPALLMAGLAAYGYTTLAAMSAAKIDLLAMQTSQGRETAHWQLMAAARAGNARAARACGMLLLNSKEPDSAKEGLEWLGRAAGSGEQQAALDLGRLYFFGLKGQRQNYAEARRWLAQAASQPAASYYLALMDKNGLAGPADPDKAVAELRKSANGGIAEAQFLLGNAYLDGDHVQRNETEAARYFEQAAAQEHAGALQALALAYSRGEMGLPRDEKQAHLLLSLAADALQDPPHLP